MSDTFLAPDDIERAFPSVDHSLSKPLWLIGVNFLPRKLVFMTEWSSPEMTGAFGQWIKLFTGVSYLSKQGFNYGPKRGFYIAEMANEDLAASLTKKLHVSGSPSEFLILPEAKSTLMVGTFLGASGLPYIQSPIHGGKRAQWGSGAAASVGLVLQHIETELETESWILRDLIDEFTAYVTHDRSSFENLEASHTVPFAFTEAVTTVDWAEIAVESGVVPQSMFDDPPASSESSLTTYLDDRDINVSEGPSAEELNATFIPQVRAEFVRDGELDLRELFDWHFEDPPSDSDALVRDYTLQSGRSMDDLFEGEFKRHWVDLRREEREAELLKLIRFDNALTMSDYEPEDELTEFDVMLATVSAKVFVFALAADAVYGTAYMTALRTDPLVFGQHEFGDDESND